MCLVLVMATVLCGCVSVEKEPVASLGKYESVEFYSYGDFQDYTDYGKYVFEGVNFEENEFFTKMTADDKESLFKYIENFEECLKTIGSTDPNDSIITNYDFDIQIVSDDDYIYIYDDPDYPDFGNYDVYFFDTETNVLYYFHSNI